MGQATLVRDGKTINYTPSAAVSEGDIVIVGPYIGVATRPIAASAQGALMLEGEFRIDKDGTTGPVFAVGDLVDWDPVNELAVHPGDYAAGTYPLGVCVAAAGTDQAYVDVRLQQVQYGAIKGREVEASSIVSGSKTLDIQDVGKVLSITGDDTNVVTLPATAAGLHFIVAAAVDGSRVAISPASADKIMGPDLAGTDNKDLILAAATARKGDFVELAYGGADGWLIRSYRGLWSVEA